MPYVALKLVRFMQYASLFHYISNIFASLKRNNLHFKFASFSNKNGTSSASFSFIFGLDQTNKKRLHKKM